MKKWLQEELSRKRLRRLVREYALLKVEHNGRIPDECFDFLGLIYRPTEKIPAASAKRILRYQEVQQLVNEEIKRILELEGITPQSIIRKDQEIQDLALSDADYSVAERINRAHAKMLGMDKPEKVTREQHITVNLDNLIAAEERLAIEGHETQELRRERLAIGKGDAPGSGSGSPIPESGRVDDMELRVHHEGDEGNGAHSSLPELEPPDESVQ